MIRTWGIADGLLLAGWIADLARFGGCRILPEMVSRDGMAGHVNVDPDILLLDEVLSVADGNFTAKSKARIEEFKKAGKTILFVNHDLGSVEEWCHKALWLGHGYIAEYNLTDTGL
ncbi:hypothetical protein ACFLS0_05370 [Candidatus Bipolaricaulota bacterium]